MPRMLTLTCQAVRSGDLRFDLNQDGVTNRDDVEFLVQGILNTNAGDANVDGVFNSADLVRVFQIGQYEDDIEKNSVWSSGDWNCDGDFTTSDLITAFQGWRLYGRQPSCESGLLGAVVLSGR